MSGYVAVPDGRQTHWTPESLAAGRAAAQQLMASDEWLFSLLPMTGTAARAYHTATLLTDGRVLVVGGSDGSPAPVATEVWDVANRAVTAR